MKKKYQLTALITVYCLYVTAAPMLEYSGILAQSAENNLVRFAKINSAGIVNDPETGELLILNGGSLYQLSKK